MNNSGDPAKQKVWDRGLAQIEGYRQRHGVKTRSGPSVRRPNGAPNAPGNSKRYGG